MNKKKLRTKRYLLLATLGVSSLFLSACMRFDQTTGEPQGFLSEIVYRFLVIPLNSVLSYLGDFLGNYGLAIIVFTILFRLILLPFMLRQQKKTIESQVKMARVQPVTQEIQKEMQASSDPMHQQALNLELMEIYRENDINLSSQMASGCLPLLLQMPIFVAMIQVLRQSTEIANTTFLGIQLGERSIILVILTALVYFLQSQLMIKSMPEEQQATAGATMYVTPIMMVMITLSSPAGLSLYWLVSGLFSLVQQIFTNHYYKPKIEKEIKDQFGDSPIVSRKRKNHTRREGQTEETANSPAKKNRNRNAGKQQRRNK